MVGIKTNMFLRYAKHEDWNDCMAVNYKIEKGWSFDKISAWLIKQIKNPDGYDFSYDQAIELRELVLASNNYRL